MVLSGCAQPTSAGAPAGVAGQPEPAEAVGSLRNARVAYPMAGGRVPVTFLAGELTAERREELAKIAPNVRVISGLTPAEALARAGEVEGVEGRYATPEFVARAGKLVWVQSMSAGVERFVADPGLVKSDRIVLTNMRAVHGPAIADHAFAMLLELTRGMRFFAAEQARGHWTEDSPDPKPVALQGRTMLVVGLGGIGTEIAQRAHGFGMRVTAIRRTDAPGPEFVRRIGHSEDLLSMLPEADVVAICLPLTSETRGLFSARAFGSMKQGSYLINIARGPIVDTGALVGALQSGKLAGACLDVTDPEPLPPDHLLWKMSNVVITPHAASDADLTRERAWVLLRENIRRFGAGEPLLNTVDKRAGY